MKNNLPKSKEQEVRCPECGMNGAIKSEYSIDYGYCWKHFPSKKFSPNEYIRKCNHGALVPKLNPAELKKYEELKSLYEEAADNYLNRLFFIPKFPNTI